MGTCLKGDFPACPRDARPLGLLGDVSLKCCGGHVEAAKVGHIACLRALSKAGHFLPLDSTWTVRKGAGEARKLQAWEVAIAACEAGRPDVLAWVLRSPWRSCISFNIPWHVRDTVPQWDQKRLDAARTILRLKGDLRPRDPNFQLQKFPLAEIALSHAVIKSPTAKECLDALLHAGCRSEWLPTLAVLEGKGQCFWAAVEAKCPVTGDALIAAVHQGCARLLEDVFSLLKKTHLQYCQTPESLCPGDSRPDRCLLLWHSVPHALHAAVSRGHVPSVTILLKAASLCNLISLTELCKTTMKIATELGQLRCLKAAHREGGRLTLELVYEAARRGHQDCLDYILTADPTILSRYYASYAALKPALQGGSLACVRRLEEAGCTWEWVGPPGFEAAYSANPAPLLLPFFYCGTEESKWQHYMEKTIESGSVYLASLLYEIGYELHRPRDLTKHPATAAIRFGNCACLKLVVERSGLPPAEQKHSFSLLAALKGEEMLQWVLGLGLTLHPLTAIVCARRGDVGALRWLYGIMPTTVTRFAKAAMCEAAVMGNSLECLRFARQRGHLRGSISEEMASAYEKHCPSDYKDGKSLLTWSAADMKERQGWDLDMLRYLVRHMDPEWARSMLKNIAGVLEHQLVRCLKAAGRGLPVILERPILNVPDIEICEINWPVIMFLGKKLGDELPEVLAMMAGVRAARAKALAGVVYQAGKLAKEGRPHRCLAAWEAMASLPPDLWERIASEAHISIPARDLPL